jgi:hypothetical protein
MTVRDRRQDEVAAMVARLRKAAGKAASHALVGPALIYRGEELGVMVIVSSPGRRGRLVEAVLGRYEPDPQEDALAAAFDTVLWLRESGGLTKRDGDVRRQELIRALRRCFRRVEACEDDLALAQANLRWFPCADARRVLEGVRAEQRLGA